MRSAGQMSWTRMMPRCGRRGCPVATEELDLWRFSRFCLVIIGAHVRPSAQGLGGPFSCPKVSPGSALPAIIWSLHRCALLVLPGGVAPGSCPVASLPSPSTVVPVREKSPPALRGPLGLRSGALRGYAGTDRAESVVWAFGGLHGGSAHPGWRSQDGRGMRRVGLAASLRPDWPG